MRPVSGKESAQDTLNIWKSPKNQCEIREI